MRKALVYCGIALLTAVLPGCKEMKDAIDPLKRPYPTGITLLQSEITVLNGSTLKVPFRVNPSNYIVQAEDLRLDAIRSQITKASYVTTIPECSLVGVTPYKNQAGETCEGQWIAEIEILDGAYYGDIDFTLVLNYTDADNRRVALTSATFGNLNTRIKLTGDMVDIDVSPAVSYVELNNTPIATSVRLLPCAISEGSATKFDMEDAIVDSCKLGGEFAGYFFLTDKDNATWTMEPIGLDFPKPDEAFVPVDINIYLTDRNDTTNHVLKTALVKVYQTRCIAPAITLKVSDYAEITEANKTLDIEMGEIMAAVGVTSELFQQVRPPLGFTLTKQFMHENGTSARTLFRQSLKYKDDKGTTSPEAMYLQLIFFAPLDTEDIGSYYISLNMLYSRTLDPQPTIAANIKIPVIVTE